MRTISFIRVSAVVVALLWFARLSSGSPDDGKNPGPAPMSLLGAHLKRQEIADQAAILKVLRRMQIDRAFDIAAQHKILQQQ